MMFRASFANTLRHDRARPRDGLSGYASGLDNLPPGICQPLISQRDQLNYLYLIKVSDSILLVVPLKIAVKLAHAKSIVIDIMPETRISSESLLGPGWKQVSNEEWTALADDDEYEDVEEEVRPARSRRDLRCNPLTAVALYISVDDSST